MNCRRIVSWMAAIGLLVVASLPMTAFADEPGASPPPATVVPLDRDVPRHKEINARAKQGDVDLIFIGDSITQGWEGAGKEAWAKRYGSRKAMNAGIGGDQTQHVLWRLDNGNIEGLSPTLAVIMIGTNNFGANSPEEIALGIKAIVKSLRQKLPKSKILVLGVFPRGEKSDDPLRAKNVAVNKLIQDVGDDKMVTYLNINDKLLSADGTQDREIMPDLVHLSPKGYEIWGEAIEPKISELLGEKAVAFPELPKGAGAIDKDAPKAFTETKSGLKYRILRKGTDTQPKATNTVEVHYHGWLDGGKVFDSSYKRGKSIGFPLNGVIKGWTEGMQLVGKGGMIELQIPSELGYGSRGAGADIPPDSPLHFLVELLEVK